MEVLNDMIRSLARHINRCTEDGVTLDAMDSILVTSERVQRGMVALLTRFSPEMVTQNLRAMDMVISTLTDIATTLGSRSAQDYHLAPLAPLTFQNDRGRPQLHIPRGQLLFFLERAFSATQIAMLLQVSLSTVRRRLSDFGLSVRSSYSTLSDAELDRIVTVASHEHPHWGYRLMQGHLLSLGHRVQQTRIRESLMRVDPEGIVSRWITSIRCRTYSVAAPNSLWHVDGNHKLIRWRLVIHAAIDGYSRLPVFCVCSDNNRSDTVLSYFLNATSLYGIPSRIRTDMGTENVQIVRFMLSHPLRGPGRGSAIVGSSVHNQRIERFWRDLFIGCTGIFYHLFYYLEETGILDPNDEIHLFCLHFVYIPYINYAIQLFTNAWSDHPMSTAGNRSPNQLWIEGMLINNRIEEEDELFYYGIDWDAPIPQIDQTEGINIPQTAIPISSQDLAELSTQYHLQRSLSSNYHAVDVFLDVLHHVEERIAI